MSNVSLSPSFTPERFLEFRGERDERLAANPAGLHHWPATMRLSGPSSCRPGEILLARREFLAFLIPERMPLDRRGR